MEVWMMIGYGLACAFIGVIVIAVPFRARVLELVTDRDLWRARALAAEGYAGRIEDADVKVVPQEPREHGLEMFYDQKGEI